MNIQIAYTTQSPHVAVAVAGAGSRPGRICAGLLAGLGVAGFLLVSAPALAQAVGAAQSFAILGGTAVTATAPAIIVNGDVGIDPNAASFITGFPVASRSRQI